MIWGPAPSFPEGENTDAFDGDDWILSVLPRGLGGELFFAEFFSSIFFQNFAFLFRVILFQVND
jgi:hypothetical protein